VQRTMITAVMCILMTHYFEKNKILCQLPSHTSHKLQPYDVGIFGRLKTVYREQVEQQFRRGGGAVRKEHFTRLYNNARYKALTSVLAEERLAPWRNSPA
jgi:hypothetical protein